MQKRSKKLNLSRETVVDLTLSSISGGVYTNYTNDHVTSCIYPCVPPPNQRTASAG